MLVRLNEGNECLGSQEDVVSHSSAAPAVSPIALSRVASSLSNVGNYPRDICLHQLFEAQVERTPDAISLIFRHESLTYREMNARANQVAHRLRKLGVGPETLVGVYMERSLEMVIAMYGILKAGGAYVPLDPGYPAERLAFMLADTKVSVVLTQAHLAAQISNLVSQTIKVICLDTEAESLAQESAENIASGVKEEHLAYVMYTSGSTGQPKGVMIEHRGICNQLQWMQATYPLTTNDAVLLKTPFSFDLSLYEFFSPLIAGARLVIAEPDGQKDTAYLVELIQRERITTLFMVPSLLQILLEDEAFSACTSLKDIFCSGEPLPFTLQQRFFARMTHTRLHNLYGPTEASVECTYWDCERETKRTIVPVGRSIANYQIYILDEELNPVPVGQSGELCIGGIGLARGYLNQAELTAEKFRVLRFESRASKPETRNANPEIRLYRTGDLARLLPDRVIECLGRMDFQVKIRGHRIELGEIETVLAQHSAVRECVVTAREDVPGDQRLVAYYLTEQNALSDSNALRQHLKQKLPDYMLPSAFVRLDAFPLSPNGKLDRRQLPAPEKVTQRYAEASIPPANEIESRLAAIWEQALRLQTIGVTDNFFDLGGHSLLAVRIFRAIEEKFGKKLPLATLFQFPTIRQLALLLTEESWQPSWSSLVPLQAKGDRPPFFCVHAVGGNVLEYYELARQIGNTQPFFGLQSVGLNGQQPPLKSIEAMAAHYLHEIRQLQPEGPYYLGGRSFGGVVAYEMAQQLRAQGQDIALIALLDTDPIGWLKTLPRRRALTLRVRFLALRIQQHLRNLRGLSGPGRFNYIREKIAYKQRKIETWRWQLRRVLSSEERLPETLQDVEEFNYLAAENYLPRIYPGKVTFFCAKEEVSAQENQFGWQTLATDGVEVVEVPGDHQSMIKEPHVNILAEQLKLRLSLSTSANKPIPKQKICGTLPKE
ncbi:MAG: amino acid adenylation domain-containing protein [Acidobacteria bacterium]|nr:amino acid adenylation domain-containing protein [Acidobacteriota bacterium]